VSVGKAGGNRLPASGSAKIPSGAEDTCRLDAEVDFEDGKSSYLTVSGRTADVVLHPRLRRSEVPR